MEQWNESDCKLSLAKLMEIRYIFEELDKRKMDLSDLSGKNISELKREIEKIVLNDIDADNVTNKVENYVKEKKKVLFKILDTIIENSADKIKNENTGRCYLNQLNCEFILQLLDDYEAEVYNYKDVFEEKSKKAKPLKQYTYHCLSEKQYDMIDDTTLDFLYKGLIDLAKNEETNLQIEEVNREWNLRFNPLIKEIPDLLEELSVNVEYCKERIRVGKENLKKLENIKEMLKKCNDELNLISQDIIPYDIELGTDFSTYSRFNYESFIDSDLGGGFELDSDFEIENLVESILPLIKLHAVNESKRKDKK